MDVSWRFRMTTSNCPHKSLISSSERLLFRLFDFFGAFLLDLVTVELEGAGLGCPALFLLFASFICWTIIGIGTFYVFLYFIGTLRFGYSFLLACTDFFIFFTRTLSFARINIVTMFRNKPGKGDSFLISVSLSQLSRNLSVVVFVDKTNSNIALRVCRHFVLRQFVKDAWLWAWVIHAEHIRAMWLAAV